MCISCQLHVYITHLGTPKVRHTSQTPPIFSRPSTKNTDKTPLYKFSLNCFFPEVVSSGVVFVRSPFCQNTLSYNRKWNITLNFMFHMYDKNFYKRDVTCSWPPPSVTNCHTFSDPLPLWAWRTLWTAPKNSGRALDLKKLIPARDVHWRTGVWRLLYPFGT